MKISKQRDNLRKALITARGALEDYFFDYERYVDAVDMHDCRVDTVKAKIGKILEYLETFE